MKQTITGLGHELQAWFEPAGWNARILWVAGTQGLNLRGVDNALKDLGWIKQDGVQQDFFDTFPPVRHSYTRRRARRVGDIAQGKAYAGIARAAATKLMPEVQ